MNARFQTLSCRAGRWLLLVALAGLTQAVQASPLRETLLGGRHVLLMRHADAPGFGDPPGFVAGDCRTQRNLGDAGRSQARSIGRWLRQQGISHAQVWASPWCRCVETARLLDLGEVAIADGLGSFFEQREHAAQQTRQLQHLVAQALAAQPGRALILVTHQVNISAYVGVSVGSGEMVRVRVDSSGRALQHERLAVPSTP